MAVAMAVFVAAPRHMRSIYPVVMIAGQGLGFKPRAVGEVQGFGASGFRVQGSRVQEVQGSGFKGQGGWVQGSGGWVQGSGGSGFREVQGFHCNFRKIMHHGAPLMQPLLQPLMQPLLQPLPQLQPLMQLLPQQPPQPTPWPQLQP